MHKKFDHQTIEKKWQERWKTSGIYNAGERDSSKEKEYVLVEWPYPSGNLHIGHWFAFAVSDIYVRARRMQGKQVLFPMGFDAFGLPAENAAIKNKLDPRAWTESNIAYMRTQLESMGNAFSWDKTTSSTDPEYFAWTQWMFTKFVEKGLAYRGRSTVNWCPGCNTVIANEQVTPDNTCERSGDRIEQRSMEQWMLKITDYAERLLSGLDTLDWPSHIKDAQRQWIGRSQGAHITFPLSSGDSIGVFTTRADTLFGATCIVIAPEHPILEKLKPLLTNADELNAYQKAATLKREEERTADGKVKTGVRLTGVTATNPATGAPIPVFVADYIIASYGTGAIMAVPAHDERDFEFATAFELPIVQVIEGDEALPFARTGVLMNSGEFSGTDSVSAAKAITEKVGGSLTNTYRLRDWSIGRQRYWGVPIPIVYDPEGRPHTIPKEHLPWLLPTDVDFTPTGEPPLAKSNELKERVERIFGNGWRPEVETMDTFVDSSWYFFRYIDNHNADSFSSMERQKEWLPVDLYFGGSEHNTMHLLYSRFWTKALFDLGLSTVEEPYVRRINRGLVLGPDGNKMSKSKGNVVDPDEQVRGLGGDTVKMYLAFMGPYGELANYPWDMGGIAGIRRFLERVYGAGEYITDTETNETTRLLHRTIDKVTTDIQSFKFNTAISALMVFLNHVEKNSVTRESFKVFLRLLAAFAPHITEELWEELGGEHSIHQEKWPVAEEAFLKRSTAILSVQINGKMRGTVTVAADADEATVLEVLRNEQQFASRMSGNVSRVFYVPGRIINLIIESGGSA